MTQLFKYVLHVKFGRPVTEQHALQIVHDTLPRDHTGYTITDVVGIHEDAGVIRYRVALDVQNAVNLRALAREFVKVVDQAMDETQDTGKTWDDPAVVLFVNKFESLCRSEARFSAAYAACQEKANG